MCNRGNVELWKCGTCNVELFNCDVVELWSCFIIEFKVVK